MTKTMVHLTDGQGTTWEEELTPLPANSRIIKTQNTVSKKFSTFDKTTGKYLTGPCQVAHLVLTTLPQ